MEREETYLKRLIGFDFDYHFKSYFLSQGIFPYEKKYDREQQLEITTYKLENFTHEKNFIHYLASLIFICNGCDYTKVFVNMIINSQTIQINTKDLSYWEIQNKLFQNPFNQIVYKCY